MEDIAKQLFSLEFANNILEIKELFNNSFIERAYNKIIRLKDVYIEKYYGTNSPLYLVSLLLEFRLMVV